MPVKLENMVSVPDFEEFIAAFEQTTQRRLVPQKGGRPRKRIADKREKGSSLTP